MRWFRFYAEVVHDPKVQQLPAELFKAWVNVLCMASNNEGKVSSNPGEIAFTLRVTESRAERIMKELTDRGLLEVTDSGYTPHNWEGRQYAADVSTSRVRKYRENIRKNGEVVGKYAKHKEEIFKRDGLSCLYCGSTESLCIDHIVPVSMGGKSDPDNLATSCKSCNSGKSGRTPAMAGMKSVTVAGSKIIAMAITKYTVTDQSVTVTETAPDTEQIQNRTEQIQKQSDLQRACRNDPSFAEFHRICTERGILGASDEDWMWTYQSWKVLDFEQKAKALHDLKTRNAQAVEIASPALPQNYVKSKKWNRPQLNGSSPHRTLSRAEEMLRDA